MAYALSPGVTVIEKDFTSIVPAVASSTGAFAGAFQWGPVMYPVLLSSENDLVAQFGKPTQGNFESFFTAANFLSYTGSLYVTRADSENGLNATSLPTGTVTGFTITDGGDSYLVEPEVVFSSPDVAGGVLATGTAVLDADVVVGIIITNPGSGYLTTPTITIDPSIGAPATADAIITIGGVKINNVEDYQATYVGAENFSIWAAKYQGILGNSLKVSFADSATFKGLELTGSAFTATLAGNTLNATGSAFMSELHVGAIIKNSAGVLVGTVTEIVSDTEVSITDAKVALTAASGVTSDWEYAGQFDDVPSTSAFAAAKAASNDELHIIVIDEKGELSGTAGTILEKYSFVSKASDAKKFDGSNNYYRDVINNSSKYIWWMGHTTNVGMGSSWGLPAAGLTFNSLVGAISTPLSGAVSDFIDLTGGLVQDAWSLYLDDSAYDISLIPVGKANSITANFILQNIAEVRKDCVAFISPQDVSTGEVITGSGSATTDKMVAYRDAITSSSYGFMDSGYKYQYDRYNDVYRWVPLNGDMAGISARNDYTNDAWWSPAGFNRGQVKNVVKIAVSLTKDDRDTLFKKGINPVVSFPGQGVVLYGDKTLQAKPSAFDRINVRRLFIILEKTIATASKYQLFEFNDAFTQTQFKNIVEPFLRDVKGRRGITDFKVVCDSTNNTPFVVDSNNFVGDIYIKPSRSISFITLNFIATATGVNFSVVGG